MTTISQRCQFCKEKQALSLPCSLLPQQFSPKAVLRKGGNAQGGHQSTPQVGGFTLGGVQLARRRGASGRVMVGAGESLYVEGPADSDLKKRP